MSSLTHQSDHLAWQQRLHHEQHSTFRFNTALQTISEQTGSPINHQKLIPYKYVHGAHQKIGRGVICQKNDPCLFMVDSSQTSASNPNSMRNMGIPLKVEPTEIVLENDMLVANKDEEEKEEEKENPKIDDALDEEIKKYLEKQNQLEKESEKSYASKQSKRHKDKEIMEYLEKRNKNKQETTSISSSKLRNKPSNLDDAKSISSNATSAARLINELKQKVKEAEERPHTSQSKLSFRNNNKNPLIKSSADQQSNQIASRGGAPLSQRAESQNKSLKSSASCTSIQMSQISRASVASQVKSLKNELQRERNARKKAEGLLKSINSERGFKK